MIAAIKHYTSGMLGKARDKSGEAGCPGGNLSEADFVVFDTELTGLKARSDAIVSIGAVKMQGDRILIGQTFDRIVDAGALLTAKSVVIHEITPAEASASPGIETLLPEFLTFCGDAVVVGHVVSIDLQFINRQMKQLYGRPLRNSAVDTYALHRWLREKEENHCAYHGGSPERADLFSLAQKYHIQVQQAHNALGDAFVTAQLFQRQLRELERRGVVKLSDLLKIGKP